QALDDRPDVRGDPAKLEQSLDLQQNGGRNLAIFGGQQGPRQRRQPRALAVSPDDDVGIEVDHRSSSGSPSHFHALLSVSGERSLSSQPGGGGSAQNCAHPSSSS